MSKTRTIPRSGVPRQLWYNHNLNIKIKRGPLGSAGLPIYVGILSAKNLKGSGETNHLKCFNNNMLRQRWVNLVRKTLSVVH